MNPPLNELSRLKVGLLVPMALALSTGCSPPTPPASPDVELSVQLPNAASSDTGELGQSSMEPPQLNGSTKPASFQGDGNLVASTDDPPELVPTPNPDAKHQKPEVVPTPPGDPIGQPPPSYDTWAKPDVTLVFTGHQRGYIEPCGCTGLENQKGGVARRFTLMDQLRSQGWQLLPVDAGNQVRRTGRQAEIKLQQSARALKAMKYQAVGFGPDDLRLGVGELLAVAAGDDEQDVLYVSSNVVLIDPSLMPQQRVLEQGGLKVGVTTVLDPESLQVKPSDEIEVKPVVESLKKSLAELKKGDSDFTVFTFYGSETNAKKLAVEVPGFDLMVVAGGYGEPTYQTQEIKGSKTRMILTGSKGMYAGLIGLSKGKPMKYARVALTHEFQDAPEMRELMKEYQEQLRDLGLKELGLKPIPHPTGRQFVGSEACGKCHTEAYTVWKDSHHFHATDHIVKPPKERGDIERHFDPECLSCHVTGWNPQNYYPYESGYLELQASAHLTGSGCENCHGPGADHAAAEQDGSGAPKEVLKKLRDQIKLSYEDARDKCMECHDIDNSPDFHKDDAFEDRYWPDIEHYGVD